MIPDGMLIRAVTNKEGKREIVVEYDEIITHWVETSKEDFTKITELAYNEFEETIQEPRRTNDYIGHRLAIHGDMFFVGYDYMK